MEGLFKKLFLNFLNKRSSDFWPLDKSILYFCVFSQSTFYLYYYNSGTHHASFDLYALLFFRIHPSPGMPLQCSPTCYKSFFFKVDLHHCASVFSSAKWWGLSTSLRPLIFSSSEILWVWWCYTFLVAILSPLQFPLKMTHSWIVEYSGVILSSSRSWSKEH